MHFLPKKHCFWPKKALFLPKDLQKVRKLQQILIRDKIVYVWVPPVPPCNFCHPDHQALQGETTYSAGITKSAIFSLIMSNLRVFICTYWRVLINLNWLLYFKKNISKKEGSQGTGGRPGTCLVFWWRTFSAISFLLIGLSFKWMHFNWLVTVHTLVACLGILIAQFENSQGTGGTGAPLRWKEPRHLFGNFPAATCAPS